MIGRLTQIIIYFWRRGLQNLFEHYDSWNIESAQIFEAI
jgi:hypothetical protein